MSDNGRKRCRKSKLVPRHCAELVGDDSVLQEPAKKKSLLEKIKKEPEDYVPPEAASHKFSVKVEVEDVEEAVPEEDSSSYMQYLFSLSKESQSTEPTASFEFADNNLLLENKLAFEEENSSFVDVRKVQKMLVTLHKKYPLEREAVLHTRNQWGKAFNERYGFEFLKTPLDEQLQDVLRQWRTWSVSSRTKDSPFSYKCYVCVNAWWSLTEFKTHLTMHEGFKLQIEVREQECNIIAYDGNVPGFQDVHVHGKCLKCAKTYDHHLTYKTASEMYYYCNYCKERFYTCNALAKHEGTCTKNPIRVLSISQNGKEFKFSDFSCQVCSTVFLSNTDLTEHLVICHKVRSDEPIITKLKNCKSCNHTYYTFQYHICLKKNMVYECKYCNAKFQNKQMLENHLDMWNKVVRCRLCDKFLMRGCMAGQHYALHSDNFVLVHRCLVCRKKMKIFTDEASVRQHKTRYHNRIIGKRPQTDMIIMAKAMLQQCMLDPNARKTIPNILHAKTSNPAPVTTKSLTDNSDNKSIGSKMTRGEAMLKVRVYAPGDKDKKHKKNVNSNNEPHMTETTICHDYEVTETTEEVPPEKEEVKIKDEKNDDTTNEKEKDNTIPDNELLEIRNVPVKEEIVEVVDIVKPEKPEQDKLEEANNVEIEKEQDSELKTANEGSKDLPKLMEELNEFLDIKPDVIKVKEERLSDDESQEQSGLQTKVNTIETETDLSKVFQSSNTFAEEVTEFSEHSKVFEVSKSILETNIKKEIKQEPEDDDLIFIDSSDVKQECTSDKSESILNLEPEVILKAGYRKRKTYRCTKCDYKGYHREYKEHINNHCMKPKKGKEKKQSELIFKCTKCGGKYANIKRYALHFEKHGYRYMSCPQCGLVYDSITKLVPHLNSHVKNQFIRMQVITETEDTNSKVFQCKTCKEVENARGFFNHWERHLDLMKELDEEPVKEERDKDKDKKGEQALAPEALRQVIALLSRQERTEVKRIKTCFICDRIFERRNDIKRHFIEHLLEDAYTDIKDGGILGTFLKCQICGSLHSKPDGYKKHMRDHACLPIYECTLCNKTFSDSSNFTKHKKIHNLKAYVCDVCSKKFQAKISLEKHMEMHMTMAPIKCDRCERVFYDRSFYKRHYRQHHDKLTSKHKCLICKDRFNCLRDKWDHMWEVHKQRKTHADCPICHRSYRKFADVKKHASEAHGIQVSLSNVWSWVGGVGVKQSEGGAGVSNGATSVSDGAIGVSGVMTVSSGAIGVSSGAMSVSSGAMSVSSRAINVSSGAISVSNGAISVNGAINVRDGAISVSSGAIGVSDGAISERDVAPGTVKEEAMDSSDEDCLIIEEERETLVVFD